MNEVLEIIENIPKMPPDLYTQVIEATALSISDNEEHAKRFYDYICDVYIEDEIDRHLDENNLTLDAEQYEFYYNYIRDLRKAFVKIYGERL